LGESITGKPLILCSSIMRIASAILVSLPTVMTSVLISWLAMVLSSFFTPVG
jgi:hypothetical protein